MDEKIIIGVSGRKQAGKSTLCDYLSAWYNFNYPTNPNKYKVIQEGDGKIYIKDFPSKKLFLYNTEYFHPLGHKAKTYSFADPLKEFCVNNLGLTKEQCYGTNDQKNILTKYLWDTLPQPIRMKYSNLKEDRFFTEMKEFGGEVRFSEKINLPRSGQMTGREILQVFGSDICREMFSKTIWVDAIINKIHSDSIPLSLVADVRFVSEVSAVINEPNGYIIRLTKRLDDPDEHISETELDNHDWQQYSDHCLVLDNRDLSITQKNSQALKFFKKILKKHQNGKDSGK